MRRLISRAGPHLSDEILSRLISGELATSQVLGAEEHLAECWNCRSRREHLERAALDFVDYHKQLIAPNLPQSPEWRDRFLTRLDREAEEVTSPSKQSTFLSTFRITTLRDATHALATVLIVVAAISLIAYVWPVPKVSAKEFLDRASGWETNPSQVAKRGVIYQELSIRTPQRTEKRVIYRDIEGRRHRRLGPSDVSQSDLESRLASAGVSWDEPLSASSFRNWHDRLPSRTDEIIQNPNHQLTLRTVANTGIVREQSLTVRESDFHPIARSIELRDWGTVEIAELNYAVLDWDAANENLFESTPMPSPIPPPISIHRPSRAALADAEIIARYALHRVGADLGDAIDIECGCSEENPKVVVQGFVDSLERKQELERALAGIPFVRTHLQTEGEAVSGTPTKQMGTTSVVASADTGPRKRSPIEEQLQDYFGSAEKTEAASERAVALTDLMMAHAWALRRLGERYPKEQSDELSVVRTSSRELLEAMIRDHRTAMKAEAIELSALLRPVLLAVTDMSTESPEDPSLFTSAQRIDQLTLYLLFGNEPPGSSASVPKPAEAARSLLIHLDRLEDNLTDSASSRNDLSH